MNKDRHFRDLWNLLLCRFPSRRVRRTLLSFMLGRVDSPFYVGLNVQFLDPQHVYLSRRCVINHDCTIDARGGNVEIGNDTDIGAFTHIWTLEHDPHDANHCVRGAAVSIGSHVWIATRVTILPGVTIGRGAVVGCGAVVTHNVAENAIVAGVPAKQIGLRKNPLTYKLKYNPRFR